METGEALLIGGVLIGGVLLVSRLSSSSSLPPGANTAAGAVSTNGLAHGFEATGPVVPALAPAFALLKPFADHVTTPLIEGLNSAAGGTDIYSSGTKPVANADGTFTNTVGGAQVTYNKDGTITRHTLPFAQRHPTIEHAGEAVVSTTKSVVNTLTFGLL